MNAVFRVDASVRIGGGHLMRCLTLAEALEDCAVQARFVCHESAGEFISSPLPANAQFSFLRSSGAGIDEAEDARQTQNHLGGANPDWLILDHYDLGVDWERSMRRSAGRLLVIDDFPHRRHECDALLDQNVSTGGANRYAGLVPDPCHLMVGPRYALLRQAFRAAREKLARRSGRLRRILVFFTSGDDRGETLKAMRGIAIFDDTLQVDVVVGASTPRADDIARECEALHWRFHRQVANMAQLMAGADLAIGAGGSASWERCATGVPALVTILAENQSSIAQALEDAGAGVCLGWHCATTPEAYARALRSLTAARLAQMSGMASSLVDGLGARRVSEYLAGQGQANEPTTQ